MINRSFVDLDELVLRCNDKNARQYIGEAVASYRAGALRAAIISAWIAVAFDFIDKVRQLELQGDAIAARIGAELTAIQATQDIVRSLAFERAILSRAFNELGFISAFEHRDLTRLYEDRHRCSHPSMNEREEIFQPTAEQVRYHIRTSVDAMLSQPATSGKAALASLTSQVEGAFFPTDAARAKTVLEGGPLSKPRPSLVRNFAIVLLKRMLTPKVGRPERLRAVAALNALRTLQPNICGEVLNEKMNPLLRSVSDADYGLSIALVARVDDAASHLDTDIKTRMEQFIAHSALDSLKSVAGVASMIPFLSESLKTRLSNLTLIEVAAVASPAPVLLDIPEVRSRAIEAYLTARSFEMANTLASRLIVPNAAVLSKSEVEHIVTEAFKNGQILGSHEFIGAMQALRSNSSVEEHWWDALLLKAGAADGYPELFFRASPPPQVEDESWLDSLEPEEKREIPVDIPWPNPE